PRELHVDRAQLRQADRPVCLDGSRPGALPPVDAGARRLLQRLGALRLQDQLAVGDVLRLRRRPHARFRAAPPEDRPPDLRQALLRLPEMSFWPFGMITSDAGAVDD